MTEHDKVIEAILLERILPARRGLSTQELILGVYSRTSLGVNATDVNRVITKMVNEGTMIRLEYRPGGEVYIETMFFMRGTLFLNLEEVIANQRSHKLGKKGNRDKEISPD